MAVTVKIPTQLRSATGGASVARVDGATVSEVLDALFAQFAELVLYRPPRVLVLRIGPQQQHSGLQRAVLARNFQEAAILERGFGMGCHNHFLLCAKFAAHTIPHGRSDEPLDHPEAAHQN